MSAHVLEGASPSCAQPVVGACFVAGDATQYFGALPERFAIAEARWTGTMVMVCMSLGVAGALRFCLTTAALPSLAVRERCGGQ